MGVKVKVKRPQRYRLVVAFDFDDRPSISFTHEGTAKDIGDFMDDEDTGMDRMEDELEDAKGHITEVSMRIVRL